jgi:hypothetical protein
MNEPLQKGDRAILVNMPNDPRAVPVGTKGTCTGVGQTPWEKVYYMNWDNGSTLTLLVGTDSWERAKS